MVGWHVCASEFRMRFQKILSKLMILIQIEQNSGEQTSILTRLIIISKEQIMTIPKIPIYGHWMSTVNLWTKKKRRKVNHFAVAIKQKFTRLRVLNVGELVLTGYIHSLLSFGLALYQKWFVGRSFQMFSIKCWQFPLCIVYTRGLLMMLIVVCIQNDTFNKVHTFNSLVES